MIVWCIALLAAGLTWVGYRRLRICPYWLEDAVAWSAEAGPEARISVIVPARNEARTLPELLRDLAPEGPPGMEILAVDDHSIDGTSACIREAALADPRVRLILCQPKPDTWPGKNWAIAQGVAKASGEWLLFCDADLRIRAGTLAAAMSLVRGEELDALSLIPGMEKCRLGPALLLACFAVSRALLFLPAVPGRRGLVQGAFLLVRRTAYEAVGGHPEDLRTLTEDIDLGYRLVDAGFRVRTYPARSWIRARMYDTLEETVGGLQKHLFAAFSFSVPRLVHVVALHLFLFLFPFVSLWLALFLTHAGSATAAEIAVLVLSGAVLLTQGAVATRVVRAESLPWVSVPALPLSYFGMGAALWGSVRGYRQGGIQWKGRTYKSRQGKVELQ